MAKKPTDNVLAQPHLPNQLQKLSRLVHITLAKWDLVTIVSKLTAQTTILAAQPNTLANAP
ncbi:hypothetical protein A2191_00275 [Candidatus Woesebacteria bacterium RIFOXYA1_FULL_38_9]|nr:MAG: hypothetical protein A2191_00275 [Candidatus Woesebacteria bacterium RIFOXYA1_FULL_38_9]